MMTETTSTKLYLFSLNAVREATFTFGSSNYKMSLAAVEPMKIVQSFYNPTILYRFLI